MVSELLAFSEASRTTKCVVHLRELAVDAQDGTRLPRRRAGENTERKNYHG